jgi:hypothetical protein
MDNCTRDRKMPTTAEREAIDRFPARVEWPHHPSNVAARSSDVACSAC